MEPACCELSDIETISSSDLRSLLSSEALIYNLGIRIDSQVGRSSSIGGCCCRVTLPPSRSLQRCRCATLNSLHHGDYAGVEEGKGSAILGRITLSRALDPEPSSSPL